MLVSTANVLLSSIKPVTRNFLESIIQNAGPPIYELSVFVMLNAIADGPPARSGVSLASTMLRGALARKSLRTGWPE